MQLMKPYHPNFFAPSTDVQRQHCEKRLALIRPFVSGNVVDFGCSEGYFSFGVAEQADAVLGIDWKSAHIDTCRRYQQRFKDKVTFERADVEQFLTRGYRWDTALYLSVHHHIMGCHGMEAAARILFQILENTSGNMLFDIGQKNEVHTGANNWWKVLPGGDPDEWVRGLLTAAGATTIEKLGEFEFSKAKRGLWRASK